MLEGIPSSVFDLWMAYFAMEPFGELRADMRSALYLCLHANLNRPKNRAAFKPADFMIKTDRSSARKRPKRMSEEEMLAQVVQINRALGGRDLRKTDG
jgi:hypothetical protein